MLLASALAAALHEPVSRRQAAALHLPLSRRQAVFGAGCACCLTRPDAAHGLAALGEPDVARRQRFAVQRDSAKDAGFARGMDSGMGSYEAAVSATKEKLFERLFAAVPQVEPVVVELGIGTFPNAPFYARATPQRIDIVGVDPNAAMGEYARRAAASAGLAARGHTLRVVSGVGEALPLSDGTVDAVVCTLTLCSVLDPAAAVAEARRVLRPGGLFLFVEHVLSPTDGLLARQQLVRSRSVDSTSTAKKVETAP